VLWLATVAYDKHCAIEVNKLASGPGTSAAGNPSLCELQQALWLSMGQQPVVPRSRVRTSDLLHPIDRAPNPVTAVTKVPTFLIPQPPPPLPH